MAWITAVQEDNPSQLCSCTSCSYSLSCFQSLTFIKSVPGVRLQHVSWVYPGASSPAPARGQRLRDVPNLIHLQKRLIWRPEREHKGETGANLLLVLKNTSLQCQPFLNGIASLSKWHCIPGINAVSGTGKGKALTQKSGDRETVGWEHGFH